MRLSCTDNSIRNQNVICSLSVSSQQIFLMTRTPMSFFCSLISFLYLANHDLGSATHISLILLSISRSLYANYHTLRWTQVAGLGVLIRCLHENTHVLIIGWLVMIEISNAIHWRTIILKRTRWKLFNIFRIFIYLYSAKSLSVKSLNMLKLYNNWCIVSLFKEWKITLFNSNYTIYSNRTTFKVLRHNKHF